jgi:hypothetical protein
MALSPPPVQEPLDRDQPLKITSPTWIRWLTDLWNRAGGSTASSSDDIEKVQLSLVGGNNRGQERQLINELSELVLFPQRSAPPSILDNLGNAYVRGNVCIGVANEQEVTIAGTTYNLHLAVHDEGVTDVTAALHKHSDTAASGAILEGARSRGSEDAETIVQSGDDVLRISAIGFDGTDYERAGEIRVRVDGTPGNNDMPGRIELLTTPDGSATPVIRAVIYSDGRIAGRALHNNGTVTGTTDQFIASGTYTPTLTNNTNLAASTAYQCQWLRVGNLVTVSGRADVDPTAAAASTILYISLPIASNFATTENCAGTANAPGVVSESAAVGANIANDVAAMQWFTTTTANHAMYFTFTYEIL